MNYSMITNHAHARTNPLPPRGTIILKIGFIKPFFASAEITKTINMLSEQGTTNAIIRKNEMVQILNKMVHLKYPILEIWCCHKR